MSNAIRYLGDGVYAREENGRLVLTTDSHLLADARNVIILEPEVLAELRDFIDENCTW